jgi:hypothetical protein
MTIKKSLRSSHCLTIKLNHHPSETNLTIGALGFLSRQNEDFRMITEHKGDTVTLLLPFKGLSVGIELWLHTGVIAQ